MQEVALSTTAESPAATVTVLPLGDRTRFSRSGGRAHLRSAAARPAAPRAVEAKPAKTFGGTIRRRPVVESDDEFLCDVFRDARLDLDLLPKELRAGLITMQWEAQRRQQRLDHPNATREIITVEGRSATPIECGTVVTSVAAGTLHVVDIAIVGGMRDLGIGSAVLKQLAAEASAAGLRLRLQIWAGNTGARRLCERLGFVYTIDPTAPAGYLPMSHHG